MVGNNDGTAHRKKENLGIQRRCPLRNERESGGDGGDKVKRPFHPSSLPTEKASLHTRPCKRERERECKCNLVVRTLNEGVYNGTQSTRTLRSSEKINQTPFNMPKCCQVDTHGTLLKFPSFSET